MTIERRETIMSTRSRITRSEKNRNAIAGIQKHLSKNPTVILDGVALAPADIIATLQNATDTADAVSAPKAAFHKAVADAKTAATASDALHLALKTYVVSQFKTAPAVLADFGFAPPRRRAPDVSTKAGAIAKSAATRAARHTMGVRQRDEVTGHVVGITVTPVIAEPTAKPATEATATTPSGASPPHVA